jgi:excisionase family DNA binding protein
MPQFFTPAEVAESLKVSEYTVRKWLREGKMGGVKLNTGSRAEWRISEAHFNEFIQERTSPRKKEKQ